MGRSQGEVGEGSKMSSIPSGTPQMVHCVDRNRPIASSRLRGAEAPGAVPGCRGHTVRSGPPNKDIRAAIAATIAEGNEGPRVLARVRWRR